MNVAATAEGQAVVEEQRRQGNAWLAGRLPRLSGPQLATLADAVGPLEALVGDDEEGDIIDDTASDAP